MFDMASRPISASRALLIAFASLFTGLLALTAIVFLAPSTFTQLGTIIVSCLVAILVFIAVSASESFTSFRGAYQRLNERQSKLVRLLKRQQAAAKRANLRWMIIQSRTLCLGTSYIPLVIYTSRAQGLTLEPVYSDGQGTKFVVPSWYRFDSQGVTWDAVSIYRSKSGHLFRITAYLGLEKVGHLDIDPEQIPAGTTQIVIWNGNQPPMGWDMIDESILGIIAGRALHILYVR